MVRGQLILDFLFTYGAAIFVVIGGIGALAYYGIIDVNIFTPEQCSISVGFKCTDYKLTMWANGGSEPEVVFTVKNTLDTTLILLGGTHKVTCPDCQVNFRESDANCNWYNYPAAAPSNDFELKPSEKVQLSCNPDHTYSILFDGEGNRRQVFFEFQYRESGKLYPQRANGEIWSRVEAQNPFMVKADTTPPTRSGGYPSGMVSPTTEVTFGFNTDEGATCRYSTTPGADYDSMPSTMGTTGGKGHSQTVSVSEGSSYSFYTRCIDIPGNKNIDDYAISFSVESGSGDSGGPEDDAGCTPTPFDDCSGMDLE